MQVDSTLLTRKIVIINHFLSRFQQNSYIAMRTIYPDYVFDKYAPTGEIKDISKLYLKFFYYTGMDNKAADLKKNYSLNKYLMVMLFESSSAANHSLNSTRSSPC